MKNARIGSISRILRWVCPVVAGRKRQRTNGEVWEGHGCTSIESVLLAIGHPCTSHPVKPLLSFKTWAV